MPFLQRERASLYYESVGTGPALVFAHGAGGNTLSWWQQVPHFAGRHQVVSIDHRCFGRSDCPAEDFHPKEFPGDLLAVLDALEIETAVLVCQSMGGWTGLRTARDHPERVRGLLLSGTPGGLLIPEVLDAAAAIGARGADEGIVGNAALAPDFPAREPECAHLYDAIASLNTGFDPALHFPRMFDEEGRLLPDSLDGYRVPTWLVAGEFDQLFPSDVLEAACRHIPGAVWKPFPGSGHSPYFEDPTRFNACLDEFLASLD